MDLFVLFGRPHRGNPLRVSSQFPGAMVAVLFLLCSSVFRHLLRDTDFQCVLALNKRVPERYLRVAVHYKCF